MMTLPLAAIQCARGAISVTPPPPLSASGHIAGLCGIATWAAFLAGTAHGTTKRVGDVRRGRRAPRGLSLFGSLLAMALLGTLVLGVVVWLEERALEDRVRLAGVKLEALAHAVSSYVHSDFTDLNNQVGTAPVTITLAQLTAAEVLPDGFGTVDAIGRGYRIMARRPGGATTGIDVLVAQTVPAGDTLSPSAALLGERYGGVRMGLVPRDAATRLRGPTIDADVSGFQTDFAGAPQAGALAVLGRFDHASVFGDMLYRVAIPGFTDANQMETALHLGGNEIVDAGRVEAESFDVSGNIEAGGDLEVDGALTVGQALTVTGDATVVGALTADAGTFSGTVSARDVNASGNVASATVTASGTVTAATVAATGALNAGTATFGDLQSATYDGQTVTATAVTTERATALSLSATSNVVAASAQISRLVVGSCSGC